MNTLYSEKGKHNSLQNTLKKQSAFDGSREKEKCCCSQCNEVDALPTALSSQYCEAANAVPQFDVVYSDHYVVR